MTALAHKQLASLGSYAIYEVVRCAPDRKREKKTAGKNARGQARAVGQDLWSTEIESQMDGTCTE
jgi:hypothetical protein